MGAGLSPSPGQCLNLNNSPATAALCIPCIVHWFIFPRRPLGLTVVTMHLQVQNSPPMRSWLREKQHLPPPPSLLKSLSSLPSWASSLTSDLPWVLGTRFYPSSYPHITMSQYLGTKSQRGSFSPAYHSAIFLNAINVN